MPMPIIECLSPNFGDRRLGLTPRYLIIHATEMASAKLSLERLCDPESEVSCHYLIDTDGTIFQLVDESKRAWHAGVSAWRELSDLNSASLGIELQNQGDEPYPPPQIKALSELARSISQRWPHIHPEALLAHADIAPSRRKDPGPLFPWRELAELGFGIWPNPDISSLNSLGNGRMNNPHLSQDLPNILTAIGYRGGASDLIRAFQMRFNPKDNSPQGDSLSLARAAWLQENWLIRPA